MDLITRCPSFIAFYVISLLVAFTAVPSWSTPAPTNANPPFELPPHSELSTLQSASIFTSKGEIIVELFPDEAPWHVANFKYRADNGLYRSRRFHLYEPGYIIQGGAFKGDGFSSAGYSLPPEFSRLKHVRGILGMSRVPDQMGSDGRPVNPGRRSSGSQFHILLGDAPQMDGNYTIFGRVIAGNDVLKRLQKDDQIENIKVYVRK